LVTKAGCRTEKHFLDFFATLSNKTREAYFLAARDLLNWAENTAGIDQLTDITSAHIDAWRDQLEVRKLSTNTIRLRITAIRRLFNWLAADNTLPTNPAAFTKQPKPTRTIPTPILSLDEIQRIIARIPCDTIGGLRDRALIGVMVYAFARISAALNMNVEDVYTKGEDLWIRLHEKRGKLHEMPCHHNLKAWLITYIEETGIASDPNGPLFRHLDRQSQKLSEIRLVPQDALKIVRHRAAMAGIETPGLCNRSFRASGLTAYLQHPEATLETAQRMAAHDDPKATSRYGQNDNLVKLDDVEKIGAGS